MAALGQLSHPSTGSLTHTPSGGLISDLRHRACHKACLSWQLPGQACSWCCSWHQPLPAPVPQESPGKRQPTGLLEPKTHNPAPGMRLPGGEAKRSREGPFLLPGDAWGMVPTRSQTGFRAPDRLDVFICSPGKNCLHSLGQSLSFPSRSGGSAVLRAGRRGYWTTGHASLQILPPNRPSQFLSIFTALP